LSLLAGSTGLGADEETTVVLEQDRTLEGEHTFTGNLLVPPGGR
jgi:hypothetical protein